MSTRRRDFRRVVRAQCLPVPFFPAILLLFSNLPHGASKQPSKDDIPHGANEFIALKQQNVGEVRGVVSFGEIGNPTENVVAEVYRFKGDDTFQNIEKVIASKPAAACITGRDGPFSFPYLEPETYLLRIGTGNVMAINEVHAIIRVMPGAGRKNIEIDLRPGT